MRIFLAVLAMVGLAAVAETFAAGEAGIVVGGGINTLTIKQGCSFETFTITPETTFDLGSGPLPCASYRKDPYACLYALWFGDDVKVVGVPGGVATHVVRTHPASFGL